MILQRTTGGGGGMLVCLRCYLKIAVAGAGRSARRGVSNVATSRPVGGGGVRLQPFFDRSGPAGPGLVGSSNIGSSRGRILRGRGGGSGGLGGLEKTIKGGFFFGNERLFVGGRRWLGGVGVGVSTNATTTAEVNGSANVTGIGISSPSGLGIKSTTKVEEEGLQEILQSLPAHRRRQYLKSHQQQPQVQLHPQTHQSSTTFSPPPDASSILTTAASSASKQSLKRLFFTYLSLTKPRLTFLIVLSAACSYALFPLPPLLSETPSLSTLTLLYLTIGTSLCSASANTLNMYLEPQYDAQMSRTRNRPLARGLLTGRQAVIFAIVTGTAGALALWFGVNPTVAGLGALNIVLYAGVYTPLKRINVVNTWVGAVVGGIPPLMGWAAAAGGTSTTTPSSFFSSSSSSSSDHAPAEKWYTEPYHLLSHPGGWLLFSLLFAWQFPHFAALSTTIAQEYRQAGYQMMAWKYPQLNARVALRYSILTFPICFGLTYVGVTDKGFLLTSSLVNAWLVREAWRFWKYTGGKGSARGLFWASVWHLPVVMVLAMVHKEGLWRGVWRGVKRWVKGGEEDEEEEWDGEEGYVY